jgi:hypothetical protein
MLISCKIFIEADIYPLPSLPEPSSAPQIQCDQENPSKSKHRMKESIQRHVFFSIFKVKITQKGMLTVILIEPQSSYNYQLFIIRMEIVSLTLIISITAKSLKGSVEK